jgi:hypothetical protein
VDSILVGDRSFKMTLLDAYVASMIRIDAMWLAVDPLTEGFGRLGAGIQAAARWAQTIDSGVKLDHLNSSSEFTGERLGKGYRLCQRLIWM